MKNLSSLAVVILSLFVFSFSSFAFNDLSPLQAISQVDQSELMACPGISDDVKSLRRELKRKYRRNCERRGVENVRQCVRQKINRTDVDCDGIAKKGDNCPDDSNTNQEDDDLDDVGNACDIDSPSLI